MSATPDPRAVGLSDAPGGDLNLDDLFPNPEAAPGLSETQASSAAQSQAPPPPQEFFLETPTGTRYLNRDEAVRGLSEKDAAIERLRNFAIERTGFDPLTQRAVGQPQGQSQAVPAPQSQQFDFQQFKKQTYDELAAAAERGDYNSYMDKLTEYNSMVSNQVMQPYAPVFQNFVRVQAVDSVAGEVKDFRDFYHGKEYKSVLEENPDLAGAIRNAETVPQFYDRLPNLMKLAYYYSQGRRVPQITQEAARTAAQQMTPPPTARPSLGSSTLTPPSTQTPTSEAGFATSDSRKQMIRDMEAKGVLGLKW
jgi:hypothetical protein